MVRRAPMSWDRRSITATAPITVMAGAGVTAAGVGAGAGSAGYFRTQITRTTDAFASVDVPVAFTPLALRKSRTVSADTSAAWAAGAAFAGPATTSDFSSAMPANLPSASSAAEPEKPSPGAGDSARSLPLPTGVTDALTLLIAEAPA